MTDESQAPSGSDPATACRPPSSPDTERLGEDVAFLDELGEDDLFAALLAGQAEAARAVEAARGAILSAIRRAGGRLGDPRSRLIYCGAGTSGRLALLDAVELGPTFDWPAERRPVLLAGGADSLLEAREGAEDDETAGARAMRDLRPTARDVAIGLAASGTTPFVVAALRTAREAGALTIALANNPGTPLLAVAECPVLLRTGPEALAGSTRLAAGTSQKIALNILSTALMVRLGRVYRGRMVDMRVTNAKLRRRALAIVMDLSGCDTRRAALALREAGERIKPAVLIAKGAEPERARRALLQANGRLEAAMRTLFDGP